MSAPRDTSLLLPEAVIDALLHQQARLAGDVVQVAGETWALHATMPVDGEVIVAEFPNRDDARAALDTWARDSVSPDEVGE